MRKIVLAFAGMLMLSLSANGYGTTCTKPNDWINAVCKYDPLVPNVRCWTDPVAAGNMSSQCHKEVADCHLTPDGACFGTVLPDHWIVTGSAADGIRRCRCGCFAEETNFQSPAGSITGNQLMDIKENSLSLLFNSQMDTWGSQFKDINGVIFGPEAEDAYTFSTESGKIVTVSNGHPVVVVEPGSGELETVKQARDVLPTDYLLGENGQVEKIALITTAPYEGLMVNFNGAAETADAHIVIANGLKLGDNAWQQYIANDKRRMLTRTDVMILLNREGK